MGDFFTFVGVIIGFAVAIFIFIRLFGWFCCISRMPEI